MTYQYFNQYNQYRPYTQGQFINTQLPDGSFIQNFSTNPYQVSLYNQSSIYPYNPLYQPKIAQPYISCGQILSPSNETVHLFKLANGQKVAIMPRKDEATIVKTFLNGGSINEVDSIRGISHVIEHMLFKGSSRLKDGDVFKLTSKMGASTNASTDYAQVDYYITAPYMNKENLKKSIEIQGDMVCNPTFDAKALKSEIAPICSEISMMNDTPYSSAFDRTIRNLFQIDSNSQNLVAGSIATVSNLTKDTLCAYHSFNYKPQDMITVVIGDVDVNETINEIAKNFTLEADIQNIPKYQTPISPLQNPIREDLISPKTKNTTVFMGFLGPKPQEVKDIVILNMLQNYLTNFSTSDLKNKLEKISASYDLSLQKVSAYTNTPYANIHMLDLNPNDEQKGIDIFYDAIQKLQNEPITDDDLTGLKNCARKVIALQMCDSDSICAMLGSCLLDNNLDLFSQYSEIVNSITKEDIRNFANKYFDLNRVSMVVVHPQGTTKEQIEKNYAKSKYSYDNVTKNKQKNAIAFKGNKKINTDNIKQCNLNNNTHLILNKTNSGLCVFNWTINTPPTKPKNPAAPLVLSYMFEKGTNYKKQSEVERFKELNGIDASVYVNGKSIEINADCLKESASKTLDLINELMYHPKLDEEDFTEAKRFIKDKLQTAQKDATSNLLEKLYPGFFPKSASILKEIDKLTLDDIKEFYNQLLKNGSSYFSATLPEQNFSELSREVINKQNQGEINFKDSTPKLAPLFKPNEKSTVIYDTDNFTQAQINKSYKFALSGNIEDEAKFEIVNEILGGNASSRLFSDLREVQNLAYSVSSSIQSFENTGILTLNILTSTDNKEDNIKSYDNVKKSIEGFNKHINLLCSEYVTDSELEAAKMRLKQKLIGQCQNPISETALLAMNLMEPYGIKRIDKYIEAIDKITKEDVKKAACYIFSFKPTTSILASNDTIENQKEYLKTQGELISAD